ncbi:GvpL/GvpF family gas vesicle protein [Actinomadura sp. WMMB 499]|uniref:GvpL/GvpF family gas vesicle protein n=1 Tax=Actinomadura sp. WMMB 499 TaxID=1219491 RepID=UPI0012474B9E|nr:GvpL/GvpF family gas vesicle protein [Actinomadura sp. WMMB 499]QFG25200.1 GvpL/GvpF family gas vesicle protein [Actinomadura sp. WMMB 499]
MPVYVYAITDADHPHRLDDLKGVGESAGPPTTIAGRSLKAVVSDAPADLRPKRRELLAHQAVLERLLEDGAVLPMRFGFVAPGRDEVTGALDENADTYAATLKRLSGRVEYHLKAGRDQDDVLREILAESAEARRLNEATRRDPAAHGDKMALGELISQEVVRRNDAAAREIVDTLAPGAAQVAPGEARGEHFLAVSFLVDRARAAGFADLVQDERARRGDGYELTLHGPLPPYSFV